MTEKQICFNGCFVVRNNSHDAEAGLLLDAKKITADEKSANLLTFFLEGCMNKLTLFLLTMLLVVAMCTTAMSATYYSRATGNWSGSVWATTSNGTATTASITSSDSVIIMPTFTITVDGADVCGRLAIQAPTAARNGITISGSNSLTISSILVMNASATTGDADSIAVGAGTLTVDSISIGTNATANRHCVITISTGTINVNWGISIGATQGNGLITFTGAGTLNVGRNITNGGTFTASTGTVNYKTAFAIASGTAFTPAAWTYYNLGIAPQSANVRDSLTAAQTINAAGTFTVGGSGVVALGGTATFAWAGNLVVDNGATLEIYRANTVSGTSDVSGTIIFGSTSGGARVMTFTGDVTLNNGATWTEATTGNGSIDTYSFAGNFTNNGATITSGPLAHIFTGATKTIGGSGTTSFAIDSVTGTYTNTGTLAPTSALKGAGTLTNTGTLNMHGTCSITTLTATGAGNTVNYTGAAQTVKATTYVNLDLAGSGAMTTTGVTVNGVFRRMGTCTITAAPTYGGSSSLVYAGTAAQTTGPELLTTMVQPVTINNSNGVVLNAGTNINNTLTFTAGNITLGANTLTLGGTVSGAAAGQCIVTNGAGVVANSIADAGNFTFPIGPTASTFNPVTIANNTGSGAYTYTAAVAAGETPATTDDNQACSKTWTLAGTGPADLTFSWLTSEAGGSITPSSCTGWMYNGSAWVDQSGSTATGTPNTTTVSGAATVSNSWTVGNGGALPVELTSFTAIAQKTGALLKWSTATEVNNHGFDIERRTIGSTSWAKVGFVAGNGTSNIAHNYSYADNNVTAGKYAYRIKQIDNNGNFKYSASAEISVAGLPRELKLYSNYPNPFNPSTKVQFTIPENGNVRLNVYNVIGQKVATLFDGAAEAGTLYTANFNASNMSSGIYFNVLEFGNQHITHKMMLTK